MSNGLRSPDLKAAHRMLDASQAAIHNGNFERSFGATAQACWHASDALCLDRVGHRAFHNDDEATYALIAGIDQRALALLEPVLSITSGFVFHLRQANTEPDYPPGDPWEVSADEADKALQGARCYVHHVTTLLGEAPEAPTPHP